MLEDLLLEMNDINDLSTAEQEKIMVVKTYSPGITTIERFMRRLFVWAIVTQSSDVHIEGRGGERNPTVYLHVRTPKGMVNFIYRGESGEHFQEKMFSLTGTPQGGSTGVTISTRFSMELPAHYARKHGLKPKEDTPYAIDLRVEYTRTFDGFCFVARLLDQQRAPTLRELNLPYVLIDTILKTVEEPSGLILTSGPTGSGKTTLLNAILGHLNDGKRSIVTIENPVEYRLHGDGPIKQLQVRGDFTFERALRSVLRSDPDVILVGEIRDEETMDIVLKAAQTGHMVLSTVHANSAHETISRLRKLNADPYIVAEALKLVVAQRLMNRYEGEFSRRSLTRAEKDWLRINGIDWGDSIREVTSDNKNGKVGLIEAVVIDANIKQLIRSGNADSTALYRLAKDQTQYESLASAGLRAVESLGCHIKDCMITLESNVDAEAHPNQRIVLAKQYGLSLTQVSAAIDANMIAHDNNTDSVDVAPLEKSLKDLQEETLCVEE